MRRHTAGGYLCRWGVVHVLVRRGGDGGARVGTRVGLKSSFGDSMQQQAADAYERGVGSEMKAVCFSGNAHVYFSEASFWASVAPMTGLFIYGI